jgi:hypothetical protein
MFFTLQQSLLNSIKGTLGNINKPTNEISFENLESGVNPTLSCPVQEKYRQKRYSIT